MSVVYEHECGRCGDEFLTRRQLIGHEATCRRNWNNITVTQQTVAVSIALDEYTDGVDEYVRSDKLAQFMGQSDGRTVGKHLGLIDTHRRGVSVEKYSATAGHTTWKVEYDD